MMKVIKKILLFCLSLLATLIALEIHFHFAEVFNPVTGEVNEKVGFRYAANTNFVSISEGFCIGKINEYGYLGDPIPIAKDINTYRIALIGDSFIEGHQVFERHHFKKIIETKLNARLPFKVEILNFGIANFNFSDMYCYYHNYAKDFAPDLSLFFVDDDEFIEKIEIIKSKSLRPYCYVKDDSLKINYDFRNNFKYNIYKEYAPVFSTTYGKMMNSAYLSIAVNRTGIILFDKFYSLFHEDNNLELNVTERMSDELTGKILSELKNESQIEIIYKDTIPYTVRNKIMELNLPVISLIDTLNHQRKIGKDPDYWKLFDKKGHWNYHGHKVVGDYLADKLFQRIQEYRAINEESLD